MRKALLVIALMAVLVGVASASDLAPSAVSPQNAGTAISGTETGFSLIGTGVIEEPGPQCQWYFIGGRWIQICV